MARRRVIVGLGESLLAEGAEGDEPAGLALLVPIHAALLGHRGVAISRVGQDRPAQMVMERLRQLGVEIEHMQSDPDLPTGLLPRRTVAARGALAAGAAFDNLQWDFDLSDVAQQAEAVVYGALARRGAQTRSTCDRFLAECRRALRTYDLTNRLGDELDRRRAASGLKAADVLVIDRAAVAVLLPGAADQPTQQIAADLMRGGPTTVVVLAEEGQPLEAHTSDTSCTGGAPHRHDGHEAAVTALVHALLSGWALPESVALAERLAAHHLQHPWEPPRQELLTRAATR